MPEWNVVFFLNFWILITNKDCVFIVLFCGPERCLILVKCATDFRSSIQRKIITKKIINTISILVFLLTNMLHDFWIQKHLIKLQVKCGFRLKLELVFWSPFSQIQTPLREFWKKDYISFRDLTAVSVAAILTILYMRFKDTACAIEWPRLWRITMIY